VLGYSTQIAKSH